MIYQGVLGQAVSIDAVAVDAQTRRVWLSLAVLAVTIAFMLAPPVVAVLALLGVLG